MHPQKRFHFIRTGKQRIVFVLGEFGRGALVIPLRHRIEMQRDRIGMRGRQILHHDLCPMQIASARTAGDPIELIAGKILAEALVTPINICIILRAHIAAAAPVFVADAEIFQLPGFILSVLTPQICHWRYAVKGDIFHPFRELLYGPAADIARDIGLASDQLAKLHEFMRAECIILGNAAPVRIDHFPAHCRLTDTVLPMIFICKAAARPPQNRHSDLTKSLNDILPDTADIRDRRIGADIDALIDAASEMLCKMAVYFRLDMAGAICCIDEHTKLFHTDSPHFFGLYCYHIIFLQEWQ